MAHKEYVATMQLDARDIVSNDEMMDDVVVAPSDYIQCTGELLQEFAMNVTCTWLQTFGDASHHPYQMTITLRSPSRVDLTDLIHTYPRRGTSPIVMIVVADD